MLVGVFRSDVAFRSNADGGQLMFAFLENLEAETVEVEDLAHLWNGAGVMDDEARQSGCLFIG